MIFRPELAEKVLDGSKTVTRRVSSDNPRSPWWHEGCALKVGHSYAVQPGRGVPSIGRVVVESVMLVRLGLGMTDGEAQREGFANVIEFKRAWADINGGYDASDAVWRIKFRLIEREPAGC